MNGDQKASEYTVKILAAIQTCFEEDSEYFIDVAELAADNNMTHFFHALANMAPAIVYDALTGTKTNILGFNHIANKLCFQYSTSGE